MDFLSAINLILGITNATVGIAKNVGFGKNRSKKKKISKKKKAE